MIWTPLKHAPGFRKNRDPGLKPLTPLKGVLGATKADIVVAVRVRPAGVVTVRNTQVVGGVVPAAAAYAGRKDWTYPSFSHQGVSNYRVRS